MVVIGIEPQKINIYSKHEINSASHAVHILHVPCDLNTRRVFEHNQIDMRETGKHSSYMS
jgi:hypothetical protein